MIAGNIFYKNINTSLQVLRELKKKRDDIIFIQIGSSNEITGEKIFDSNLIKVPFLKRDDLPSIYKICDVLFYPSIYEGFGMPILEAMSCGLPIVCSNNSSIPEVVGNAALLRSFDDIKNFANDLNEILNNNDLHAKLVNKSLNRAKIFNQEQFHNNLMKNYETELIKYN